MDTLETLEDLENYLEVVLPDVDAHKRMGDAIFNSLTEAIFEKFGKEGVALLQDHNHRIHLNLI
jgi:hypothetical protein